MFSMSGAEMDKYLARSKNLEQVLSRVLTLRGIK